jgi:Domain of unknown function (DUF4272)
MTTTIDPNALKTESEAQILAFGGRICAWLPLIDSVQLRPIDQIIGRSLVMNALLNIYFEAPVSVIKDWLEAHHLVPYLSDSEKTILELENAQLTEQQLIDLYWYIEALWALLWVGLATLLKPCRLIEGLRIQWPRCVPIYSSMKARKNSPIE